ncbi:MAG TPA: hypothetical protein VE863_15830 [Pyrinomonadaceae bacterium]|nr:hypothetical protein [Pyrinomonadaceae bacterium]
MATSIIFAFALLKKLIIAFGFLFAIIKFAIVLIFVVLLVSIAVAMLRDWSQKSNAKDA